MRALLAALLLLAVAGCRNIPPLEDWERFQVSVRPGEKAGECIVKVVAKNPPPPPIGHVLLGQVELVEGEVILEIKGWRGKRQEGELEQVLEAKVGTRPGSFVFKLRDRGHEDEYKVFVPANADKLTIEPASGEFSERAN